jgi:hypothetical protein
MSNIIKGSGIIYTTGQPNTIPSVGTDAEFAIDVNGVQYAWNRDTLVWDNIGQGIEIANTNGVPVTTPTKFKPRFVVTPDRTLYFYSGSWGKVNPLPSGLVSSSVEIGRTGIYSGSGTLNGTTIVDNLGAFPFRIEDVADPDNFKFVLNPSNEIYLGRTEGAEIILSPDPSISISLPAYEMRLDPLGVGFRITDATFEPKGLTYKSDYQETLKLNDRSIPDVGTIKNHLTSSYATNGRNYKVLSFFILQESTSTVDVSMVLQNDYGLVNFSSTRAATGIYTLNVGYDYFTTKTVVLSNVPTVSDGGGKILRFINNSANTIIIYSYDLEGNLADINNDQEYPNSCFIEIRTYG